MKKFFTNAADRLAQVGADIRGTMVIETAIVAPVLVLMAIGGFEVSRMVSRQHELQGGVAEAEAVALASNMGLETNVYELKRMLRKSLDLNEQQVHVNIVFRCNADTALIDSAESCDGEDDVVTRYVKLDITDSYQPIWNRMGVAGHFRYNVDRLVQVR